MKKLLVLTFSIVLLSTVTIFADTTFVSGTIVSQTWTPTGSPYCVTGDIFVAGLTINPGVDILFLGNYVFEIGGVLTAVGTEQDSIIFTKIDTITGWQGIFFNLSNPGSALMYCKIEYSINSGIRIDNSTTYVFPVIQNCTIKNNSGSRGGGVYVIGEAELSDCAISDNSISVSGNNSTALGGGIYVNGTLTMNKCIINNNQSNAYASGTYDIYCYSMGGGIYINGTSYFNNCIILNNLAYSRTSGHSYGSYFYAYSYGGGIYTKGTTSISNCIFSHNSSTAYVTGGNHLYPVNYGGGFQIESGAVSLTNCTFGYNTNHGLRRSGGTVTAMNCIFYFNTPTSTQISGTTNVFYSDVQGGYSGIGNIDFNPVFFSPDSLHIVPGSLCIDAGNPDSVYYDCLPPGYGAYRNDMGVDGGPGACGGQIQYHPPILISSILDTNIFEDSGPQTIVSNLNNNFIDPEPGDILSFSSTSSNPDIQPSIQGNSLIIDSSPDYFGNGYIIAIATDQHALTARDTFLIEILPVNDPPTISGLPSSVSFPANLSDTLKIWDYVEDIETTDSLLTYQFAKNNDSLYTNYNQMIGELILSANINFSGDVKLFITVIDDSNATATDSLIISIAPATGINDPMFSGIPKTYVLFQNYPNPFNPTTQIRFGLPKASLVNIEVYNNLGQRVAILMNANKPAGYHKVSFDGLNFASGVYYYKIQAGEFVQVKKMLLVR